MQGFDSRFTDLPDYILGITREIWEDGGVTTLRDYYAPDIVVRTPGTIVIGNESVIAATTATLAEFPDRQLLGEDVIWSGTPSDGMLSSHRILSTATHAGDGVFGTASGTKLVYRAFADCHAIANRIDDEWLIRDQGAIVRQLGWQPKDYARDLIIREGGPETCVKPCTPETDRKGPYDGTGNDNEWGARLADLLTGIMNADMAMIPAQYDRAAQLEYPGHVTVHGWAGADRLWMGLRAALPSAEFQVHHRIGRDDATMPPRAAVRWSLTGRHEGWGAFGPPSNAQVHVMGITHAEFGSLGVATPRLRREYTLFDETAIWKQILMHSGEGL